MGRYTIFVALIIGLFIRNINAQSVLSDTLRYYVNKHQSSSNIINDYESRLTDKLIFSDTTIKIFNKQIDSLRILNSESNDYLLVKDIYLIKSTIKCYSVTKGNVITLQSVLRNAIGSSRLVSIIVTIVINGDKFSIYCFVTNHINNPNFSFCCENSVYFLNFTTCINPNITDSSLLKELDIDNSMVINCDLFKFDLQDNKTSIVDNFEIKNIVITPADQLIGYEWTVFKKRIFNCMEY